MAKHRLSAFLLLPAALALVLAPGQAMEGARRGLTLCFQTIIPSLFPFFVLTNLITDLGLAARLGGLLEPVMFPLFRLGGPCASPLVLGLVGGYPVGARCAVSLYEKGFCSRAEAQRLLVFCNNCGPAFILGAVGAGVFGSPQAGLLLYAAHLLAALLVGLLTRFWGGSHCQRPQKTCQVEALRLSAAFTNAVTRGLHSALNVCAFVVCFSALLALLRHFGVFAILTRLLTLLPGLDQQGAAALLSGALEVSSGVSALAGDGPLAPRLTMAAFLLGWGGLCVHAQALSFLGESGLSPRPYLLGKLLHGLLAAALTWGMARILPLALPVSTGAAIPPLPRWSFLLPLAPVLFLLLLSSAKSSGKRRRPVV